MRTPVLLRRLLGTAVGALLLIGGLVLGATGPAAADPPEIRFENLCGAVAFDWDTGTIGGDETWATTVLRDGVVIDEFEMRERGGQKYGARDGAVFEIRREGLPAREYLHRSPADCVDPPQLTVTAASECSSLLVTFGNLGTTPITGIQVLIEGVGGRDVPPVATGSRDLHFRLADGARFYVVTPLGSGFAHWFSGTYDRPERCTPDEVEVRFTDACDGVRVDLTSTAGGVFRVEVLAGGSVAGTAVLAAGGDARVDVTAAPGTAVLVRDVVGGSELGRHTVGEPACGTPTPTSDGSTPTPTSDGTAPTPDGSSAAPPGGGGGLPVTGASTTLFSLAGSLLVGTGVVLFLLARRRRLRFSAGAGRA
ncbi:LPXTG cell wall anchor domain-containing protein [Micromonospora sp. NPDC049799]|uniref:LPXTG cell wall anchor domain-containing protein n=1 Tax=Micromonospora sp. NPDC049799 TaxID=3154741 RepID=UPI0034054811